MINEIIIATNNQGKVIEIKELLKDLNIEVKSLKEAFDEPIDIEENGKTFKENAVIKAEAICELSNKVVLADDSGLEIDALNKEPGVESARFLGHDTPYDFKNNYIIELLKGQTNRTARYVCSIALAIPNKETIVVEDTMEGEIYTKQVGDHGFGYDPIFYFPPLKKTTGSLTLEEKNQYSHRAKALLKIVEIIKKENNNG